MGGRGKGAEKRGDIRVRDMLQNLHLANKADPGSLCKVGPLFDSSWSHLDRNEAAGFGTMMNDIAISVIGSTVAASYPPFSDNGLARSGAVNTSTGSSNAEVTIGGLGLPTSF